MSVVPGSDARRNLIHGRILSAGAMRFTVAGSKQVFFLAVSSQRLALACLRLSVDAYAKVERHSSAAAAASRADAAVSGHVQDLAHLTNFPTNCNITPKIGVL